MAKDKTKQKSRGSRALKAVIIVLCVLLVLCVGVFVAGYTYWNRLQKAAPTVEDTMTYDFDDETEPAQLEDDHEFAKIYEGDAAGFESYLKEWATNGGELMYSDDVINVLLIGVDTRNARAIAGLTDSMILVSVNRALGTITLTSIMRDSFAYLEDPDGGGTFNKINSAFPFYGAESLVNTVQDHFKIKIDGYAMINFAFFKAVIDGFGGVTVPVQQYEADYINSAYGFSVQAGDAVTLNGDEALGFCRSRNCDSDGDVSRTRRQRQVIIALLQQAASIQPNEVNDYIKSFLPYFDTSFSTSEIFSYASKAVIGGWARFEVEQYVMPDEESRRAHSGSIWYWAVDYPLAAQTLQTAIYGDSNIVLEDDRTSPLDL